MLCHKLCKEPLRKYKDDWRWQLVAQGRLTPCLNTAVLPFSLNKKEVLRNHENNLLQKEHSRHIPYELPHVCCS